MIVPAVRNATTVGSAPSSPAPRASRRCRRSTAPPVPTTSSARSRMSRPHARGSSTGGCLICNPEAASTTTQRARRAIDVVTSDPRGIRIHDAGHPLRVMLIVLFARVRGASRSLSASVSPTPVGPSALPAVGRQSAVRPTKWGTDHFRARGLRSCLGPDGRYSTGRASRRRVWRTAARTARARTVTRGLLRSLVGR